MKTDQPSSSLHRLIERTRGPQPWRKIIHAANALVIVGAIQLFAPPRVTAVTALATVLGAQIVFDLVRLKSDRANEFFFSLFSRLASPREATGLASSTWFTTGVLLAVALFPRPEAVSGILVFGLADPAAGYVGRRWGRRSFLGGTVEGSLVFLTVAFAILVIRHPWPIAATTGILATLLERRSWPIDDNLAVPVLTSAALSALSL